MEHAGRPQRIDTGCRRRCLEKMLLTRCLNDEEEINGLDDGAYSMKHVKHSPSGVYHFVVRHHVSSSVGDE